MTRSLQGMRGQEAQGEVVTRSGDRYVLAEIGHRTMRLFAEATGNVERMDDDVVIGSRIIVAAVRAESETASKINGHRMNWRDVEIGDVTAVVSADTSQALNSQLPDYEPLQLGLHDETLLEPMYVAVNGILHARQ